MSFATLFINRNYHLFKDWIIDFINSSNRWKIILIANSIINKNITWAYKFFPIPDHFIENWDNYTTSLLPKLSSQAKQNNLIFFVSAGPAANVIISHLTKINNNNIYIDFGSSIEFITKGYTTRRYAKNGETAFFLTYNSGVVWDNDVKTVVYRPEISEKFVEKYLKDNHLNSKFELVKTNMGDIKLVAKHDLDNIGEETPYETYQRLSAWSREQYTLSPEEDYFIQSYDNKFNTEEVCG
jgi:hypothetical protein